MRRERTSYSQDFKIKAVELSKQRGENKSVSQELNISRECMRRWIIEYDRGEFNKEGRVSKITSAEQDELARLKKELYDVKMERDILKKAVGIFSKSDR